MRLSWPIAIVATLIAGVAVAQEYRPAFQPSQLKGPPRGPQNRLLILGTPHLSALPATFKPEALGPLLDRLAAFGPEAIMVEVVPGTQCDFMRRYSDRYRESVEAYCADTAAARRATGLDVPAATVAAERMLAKWPASPAAADRRRLAALFLAGGEQISALVQWLRLPEAERTANDGLDAALVTRLQKLVAKRSEDTMIAAPLAVRLGHERVFAVDDHTADSVGDDDAAAGVAIGKAWDNPATAQRKAADQRLHVGLGNAAGVLALYRDYNRRSVPDLVYRSDFGAALAEPSPQRFGRGYVGYWETRNLRMAANIREVLGLRPGIRALMIVGVSHKGYLDAYLDQMHDVRLADAEVTLK